MATQHKMATLDDLRGLAGLASSPEPFLTVYLNTENETIPRDTQARLVDLLYEVGQAYEATRWAQAAVRERERVGAIVSGIVPTGGGLVIVSSEPADRLEWHWVPGPVEDGFRVGLGVQALPLLDLVDEHEPVAVAVAENDKARLILSAAGRVVDAEAFDAEVPAREKAGGWSAARYDRHRKDQARKHLQTVATALDAFHKRHGFRRLFVAGPTDARTVFEKELTKELAGLMVGEVPIDAHASNSQIAASLSAHAKVVERDAEVELVEALVTAAQKGRGAVTGIAETLEALAKRELDALVVDPALELPGRLCPVDETLATAETLRCPICGGELEDVDLRDELPRHLTGKKVTLEAVHGPAASALWEHGGIGGTLRIRQH